MRNKIVKFNPEFFDHYTNGGASNNTDEFNLMGYAGRSSANPRYLSVFKYLLKLNPTSIVDIGAGTCAMWKLMIDLNYHIQLKQSGLTQIDLVDPYTTYHTYMHDRAELMRSHDINVNECHYDLQVFHDTRSNTYDAVTMIGALNYYTLDDVMLIIDQLWDLVSINGTLILETNLQSPITPVNKGNYNISIDSLYQKFFSMTDNFIIEIIRKYTSVWIVRKHKSDKTD